MLAYHTTPERSFAASVVRAANLVYVGVLAPLVTAFLPRDASVIWEWIAVGVAALVVSAGLAFRHSRMLLDDSGPMRAPHPRVMIVQHVATTAAAGCFSYALSGNVGIYRLILLASLLLMAIISNRAMFIISCAWTIFVLAATSLTDGTASRVAPTVILSYSIGFIFTATLVRLLSFASVQTMHQSDQLVEMAQVASRAETTSEGLQAMVAPMAAYLEATKVVIHRIDNRKVGSVPIASWPADAEALTAAQLADVRIAAVDGRLLQRDRWVCVPTEQTEGSRIVVYAERQSKQAVMRALPGGNVARICVPVEMLATRLSLIHELQGLTRTDALTGLPNRRALADSLTHEMAVGKRTESPVSVAMIDLDHFKDYNDTFGHPAGDQLLRSFADMLRVRLRSTDFVARYGGEEFVVVLPFTSPNDAQTLFGELHRRCQELPGLSAVSFSAGVAGWDGFEGDNELVDRADAALYVAKSTGRAKTCVATLGVADPMPAAPSLRRERRFEDPFELPATVER